MKMPVSLYGLFTYFSFPLKSEYLLANSPSYSGALADIS